MKPRSERLDPRLLQAYRLLSGILGPETLPEPSSEKPPADIPMEAFLSEDELSATEILTWLFQPSGASADGWDHYFEPFDRRGGAAARHERPLPAPRPDSASQGDYDSLLQAVVSQPEEALSEEDAQSAVDCLYDFVHALGRRDVESALACVSEDYHVFEDDREYDVLGLRHQIEYLLDSLTEWELQASLAEIPVPMLHPNGILISVEIQIEAHHPRERLNRLIVEPRVVVLERSVRDWGAAGKAPARPWLIASLSPVQ